MDDLRDELNQLQGVLQLQLLLRGENLSGARSVVASLGSAPEHALLGGILHSIVTQRVERLITSVNQFKAGDMTARTNLHGEDERWGLDVGGRRTAVA